MLKKDITYKTFFSDEEVTETLYFNFTKTELTEIFMTEPQFLENLKEVYERAEKGDIDGRALIAAIKDVIRRSYGERDGETFAKSPEISDHFLKSAAFDAFFFDLMSNPEDTAAFIEGVMPADLIAEAKKDGTFPKLQDHLPKQTSSKNVFEQADLGEYKGVELVDAVSEYPDISEPGETTADIEGGLSLKDQGFSDEQIEILRNKGLV